MNLRHFLVISFSMSVLWSMSVHAHCPAVYGNEKACFMLDQNSLYIYDTKNEHNGPYKDIKAEMKMMDEKGALLKYDRVARGIYKINLPGMIKKMSVELKDKSVVQVIAIKAD